MTNSRIKIIYEKGYDDLEKRINMFLEKLDGKALKINITELPENSDPNCRLRADIFYTDNSKWR